jgi:translation initiation factor IF-2
MRVSDLAKELNTTNKEVLDTLRSLKLKAKDGEQELNAVVANVIKNELQKKGKVPAKEVVQKPPAKASKEKAAASPKPKPAGRVKSVAKKETKTEKAKEPAAKKKTAAKAKKLSAPPAEKPKPRIQISDEPFVSVKPLAKKRRRIVEDSKPHEPSAAGEGTRTSEASGTTDAAGVFTPVERPKADLKDIELPIPIAVKDLAVKFQQKPSGILKVLMKMGIFAHINQSLDEGVIRKIAPEFGFNVTQTKSEEEQFIEKHVGEEDKPESLKPRAPVVTFMGHVDHGKTTLVDKIRKSRVAATEHGAITQHIGAYAVKIPKGQITILDTPGHEAFTAMRARGANITDIVVLVVAADEGIMPQTTEAIDHARAAGVPIVVALTKIDKQNADIDRVKKQLMEYDLTPEDWGGKTVAIGVSAVTGEGVDQLLELLLLEAELLELKANPDRHASGIVIEAHMSPGKGAVSTLIVQKGTLKEGDVLIIGSHYGRVKALFDDYERPIRQAGPSSPVEILGLQGIPEAGEVFYAVDDEKQAKEIAEKRKEQIKHKRLHSMPRITLEDISSQIQEGKLKELNVIIKTDVQGSLEALRDSLGKIPSDQIQLKLIHTGVGDINASDVILAVASNAVIIGFNVGIGPRAKIELEKQEVDVRLYRIIYDAVTDISNALEGMLEPKTRKKPLARVEVREVFKLSKSGTIAGCFVAKGKVSRKGHADVVRNGEIVHSGHIGSLKRFKDDVRDVSEGMECGMSIEGFNKYQVGDIFEIYELEKIARKL